MFLGTIHLLQLLDVLLMLGSKLLNVSRVFLSEFCTNMLNHIISVLLLGSLIPEYTPPTVNLINHPSHFLFKKGATSILPLSSLLFLLVQLLNHLPHLGAELKISRFHLFLALLQLLISQLKCLPLKYHRPHLNTKSLFKSM